MRLISYKGQSRAYRALVDIIKVLATVEGIEADDAIGDVYKIAGIIGGREMTKMLRGGANVRMQKAKFNKWNKDELADYIKLLEDMIHEETLRKNGQ